MYKTRLVCSAAVAAALMASAAHAQTAPQAAAPQAAAPESGGLTEIIVTAQRKSERLQDVPISVNVVSGADLAARGTVDSMDLVAVVPGLQFTKTGGGASPFLRGVGSTGGDINTEPSVATYIDGVYIANQYANISSLANIDRIEVLKGPQGTLFGRNATGGVIQMITKDPTAAPELDMNIGYANYNTVSGSVYATGQLLPNLSANLSVQDSNQADGWGHNVVTGAKTYTSDDFSARGKLLWTPTAELTVHLLGDYEYDRNGSGDFRLPEGDVGFDGAAFPNNRYDTRGNLMLNGGGEPYVKSQQYGGSLRIDYKADFGTLVSISAYRRSYGEAAYDPDLTPIPLEEVSFPLLQHNISQEFQYLSPKSWPVSLTAGVYYFNSTAGYFGGDIAGLALGATPGAIGDVHFTSAQHSKSIAGYAQADYNITSNTKITAGIRYTHERDTLSQVVSGVSIGAPPIGYDKPTWRISVDHAFTNDIHGYASYNRGVKGGGFDILDFSGTGRGYDPERLDAYEAGIKTELFNHHLRFNAAYFYDNFNNIQLSVIPAGSTVALAQTINAAKARIQGIDTDFAMYVTHNLTFNGGFAWLDGKYLKFNNEVPSFGEAANSPALPATYPDGKPTVRTPKYSGNLGATYAVPTSIGKFALTGSGSYNGTYSFSPDDLHIQHAYFMGNASLSWTSSDGQFGISVFGRNLTNSTYFSAYSPSAFGSIVTYGAPRTYGVSASVKIR